MATSGAPRSSRRSASKRRRPPATPARITSFTVHSNTWRMSLKSSSGTVTDVNSLRFDTAPLMEVRGAEKNPGGGDSPDR